MAYIEERVESLEETADKLLELVRELYKSIKESEIQREKDRQEWEKRMKEVEEKREKDRQEWNEKFERERKEWNEKFEREKQEWNAKFEREKQEWNEKFEREKQEWNEKFEREKQQREEEFKKSQQEWDRKFEQQKREDRKKWEEMVLRLGTLVEDIVAPNIETIAKKYFGCVDVIFDGIRIKKRHFADRGKRREFDFILVCDDVILLNETKANPRPEYAKEFVEFVKSGEFWDYFPEYRDKKLIPIFSTLYMPEDIVSYLTKNKIYALAMKGDEMDILNYNEVSGGLR
ncbi:MAG: hypothetical protein N2Z81_03200 [Hydrogenothermaceae bacterium]|nr:hypothetical protein [Hydrogenothermaceae bacterium]